MAKLIDWVKQGVVGTPGTGVISLGSAVSGYIGFQQDSRVTDGTYVYYSIEDGVNRERGIGLFNTAGTTLTRSVILAKLENLVFTENPGTGLSLTSAAIVSCSAMSEIRNHRGVLVTHSTTQSVTSSAQTVCLFDTEIYDTDNFHSTTTNTGRLTIPTGVSKVRLFGSAAFAPNATGMRFTGYYKNGVQFHEAPAAFYDVDSATAGYGHIHSAGPVVVSCIPGDYFELMVWHNSGGALNVNAYTSGGVQAHHVFGLEVVE